MMKRKRALEQVEPAKDTKKVKKQKPQVKNENWKCMLEENIPEPAVSVVKPGLKNSKKKVAKTLPLKVKVEPSHKSVELGMSNIEENSKKKKKRKSKGYISQDSDENQGSQPIEDDENTSIMLKRRKKNNLETARLSSESPSDFQPLGNLVKNKETLEASKKKVVKDEPLVTSPKNKRKKKTSFSTGPEILEENVAIKPDQSSIKQGVLKTSNKKKQIQKLDQSKAPKIEEPVTPDLGHKKAKKKVRIDETESLKVKKELADAESHFSAKQLPAKIIKSKSNRNLTEEVKVSPLTIQPTKKQKKTQKKVNVVSKLAYEDDTSAIADDTKLDIKDNDLEEEHAQNGMDHDHDNTTSEDSDLEVYYINKNAEKEAKKKTPPQRKLKDFVSMPKEDQLLLVQRIQDVIPEGDTKSYNYRLQNLEWAKIAFKNYTLDECQKVWTQLSKKVRHYRLLIEITHDVKQVIEQNDLKELQKTTKTNNRKHPDMPKRPLTSYFLYYIRKRDQISKEKPELDTIDLNKFISEKYQNLPLDKKQKYELLAAKNRDEYKIQLEEFYGKHPEMRKVVIKKPPKERKAPAEKPPKRPENPYKLFMQSELDREEIAEEDKAEFKEVCREKWRQMSDSKKLGWINLAEEHELKYEEEMKEYMAKHPEFTPKSQSHKPILSREEKQLKDKLAGKPKRPPGTAYGLFISMTLQSSEIGDIPNKERWNYTSIKWKAMTDEERDQYKLLLSQVQEQYQKDFKAYLDSLPEDKRQAEILNSLPKKRKTSASEKPSTSGTKAKASASKLQTSRSKTNKLKVPNPTPPPRSAFKYFAEKYRGENPKQAWKNLVASEKEKYEEELSVIKDKYIKDFEAYLKSLTKDELAVFCANRSSQEEYSSDDSSNSDHGQEEVSSDESSEISDSGNDSDEK